MKTPTIARIGLLAALITACSTLHAAIILSEDFSYSTGSLVGQGSWNDGGGSGAGTVRSSTLTPFSAGGAEVLVAGNEVLIGNKSLFKNIGTTTANGIGDTLFVSFVAQVSDGDQYGGLRLKNSATGRQLLVGQTWDSNYWGMTVDGGSGGTSNGISTVSHANTSIIVVKINYISASTANVTLYVNPTVTGTSNAISIASSPSASIAGVALGGFDQLVLIGSASAFSLDAIKLGTTLEDVVSLSTPQIPEPSTYATLLSTAIFAVVVGMSRRSSAR